MKYIYATSRDKLQIATRLATSFKLQPGSLHGDGGRPLLLIAFTVSWAWDSPRRSPSRGRHNRQACRSILRLLGPWVPEVAPSSGQPTWTRAWQQSLERLLLSRYRGESCLQLKGMHVNFQALAHTIACRWQQMCRAGQDAPCAEVEGAPRVARGPREGSR